MGKIKISAIDTNACETLSIRVVADNGKQGLHDEKATRNLQSHEQTNQTGFANGFLFGRVQFIREDFSVWNRDVRESMRFAAAQCVE